MNLISAIVILRRRYIKSLNQQQGMSWIGQSPSHRWHIFNCCQNDTLLNLKAGILIFYSNNKEAQKAGF